MAGSLGREQNTADDENCNDQRGGDAAEIESAVRSGLGEKITSRRRRQAPMSRQRRLPHLRILVPYLPKKQANLTTGNYAVICNVGNHFRCAMKTTLTVK